MLISRKPPANFALYLVLPCLLGLAFCGNGGSDPAGLDTLLPERVGVWARFQPAQVYAGDDLFTYINGGAEIYHEFGFERVVVQDYRSAQEGTISLEIYEMADPESAYGIFTFKRSPQGVPFDVSDGEGRLEDYYLNVWKGDYLVTLTGFDQSEGTIEGLKLLGRDVAQRIPVSAGTPELVDLLPQDHLIEGSVKYFMGPLALFNSYRFSSENLFAPERGVRGDYGAGDSLFIFAYATPEAARRIFERAETYFGANPDPNLDIQLARSHILIALGGDGLERASSLLRQVRLDF